MYDFDWKNIIEWSNGAVEHDRTDRYFRLDYASANSIIRDRIRKMRDKQELKL